MTTPIPISVIVLAKNEEAGIGECVRRLGAFDEVVVVDSHSTDRTVELAEQAGARVIQFSWDGGYPKKKQWALDNSPIKNDWVLLLDADEYPTDVLVQECRELVPELASGEYGAYDITLRYKFAGKFLDHGHRVVKRSLLDRTVTRFPEVNDLAAPGIREVEGHYQPQSTRGVGRLRSRLAHDDRDPVASWFDRHNRYSGWEAHLLTEPETRARIAANRSTLGRIWDKVPFKPGVFFLYSYILRVGFLDGRAGFDYAFALSTYYWQIGLKVREHRNASARNEVQV